MMDLSVGARRNCIRRIRPRRTHCVYLTHLTRDIGPPRLLHANANLINQLPILQLACNTQIFKNMSYFEDKVFLVN